MAALAKKDSKDVKLYNYTWSGKDKSGKLVKGELRAGGEHIVLATLRRQGIQVSSVKKQSLRGGSKVTDKDITIFTRQLAVMMKAGVPLLQAFDIVGKGHGNPAVGKLLLDIKTEVETGSSLAQAFRKYPAYFDGLFCNLVAAGEQAGILDSLLDRLATYKEKILAIKSKIKSALFYPVSIMVVAFVITAVIMIFVIPTFKDLFKGFGADLPVPTQIVMNMSDFFVAYWYIIFGAIGGTVYAVAYTYKRSAKMQQGVDRLMLRIPVFGDVVKKEDKKIRIFRLLPSLARKGFFLAPQPHPPTLFHPKTFNSDPAHRVSHISVVCEDGQAWCFQPTVSFTLSRFRISDE